MKKWQKKKFYEIESEGEVPSQSLVWSKIVACSFHCYKLVLGNVENDSVV